MNKNIVEIDRFLQTFEENGRYEQTKKLIQHGDISVFEHCLRVTNMSIIIAEKLHLNIDRSSLIRGALLHDYFLYDWHIKDKSHSLHGFHHPATALKRAKEDYNINEIEQNIILRHMFPLTVVPPKCKEAWVVCLADKICAAAETLNTKKRATR